MGQRNGLGVVDQDGKVTFAAESKESLLGVLADYEHCAVRLLYVGSVGEEHSVVSEGAQRAPKRIAKFASIVTIAG